MQIIKSELARIAAVAVACIAANTAAIAADEPGATTQPLWEMNLAAFARYGPAYPASEDSQVNIIPLPFPVYRGKILRVGDETGKPVRTRLFRRDRIKIDLDFGLNFPVDSDDVDARTGMPDLDLLGEAGPELELQFVKSPAHGDLFMSLQLRGAVSADGFDPTYRGLVFSNEFKWVRPLRNARTEFLIRLTPEWASNDYMDFFYGVAPEYATADRAAYNARSGYLGTKLAFSLKHQINDDFQLRTGIRFGFYQGAKNADSPLFTADTNASVYFAFLWKFWESDRNSDSD